MDPLEINPELVEQILCRFIRNEVEKFGFHRVLVGLSGGIDSATSCFLGARALGPKGVVALLMPYKTSSEASLRDARSVVEQLGIESELVEITPQIDAYFDRYPDASRLRRGNKMARERMTILYDHSVVLSAMVLGTSNKTEALLGYTTLWGDMASAINPIGDLYKTQVRELARFLGVPEPILAKQPTADLWEGQTDEAELGFTYAEVDQILYWLVDERLRLPEIEAKGFAPRLVARVAEMVRNSQYKRRLPVIAKLSRRTIERDFRYARDWGR